MPPLQRVAVATPTQEQRREFASSPLVAATRHVAQGAPWSTGIQFYRELAQSADTPEEHALVADLAREIGRRDLAVNVAEAMSSAAEAGMGICLLPDYVAAPALQRGSLVRLLPNFRLPTLIHTRSPVKWLYEISHNNPLWLSTEDGKAKGIATGDLVKVTTQIGYFVTRAWVTGLEAALREHAERRGLAFGKIVHPLRLALTGRASGPEMAGLVARMGKDRAVARLTAAARR